MLSAPASSRCHEGMSAASSAEPQQPCCQHRRRHSSATFSPLYPRRTTCCAQERARRPHQLRKRRTSRVDQHCAIFVATAAVQPPGLGTHQLGKRLALVAMLREHDERPKLPAAADQQQCNLMHARGETESGGEMSISKAGTARWAGGGGCSSASRISSRGRQCAGDEGSGG